MPLNKEPAICYIPWHLASLRKTIFDFRSWLGDFYVLFPLAMLSQYIFGPLLFLLSVFIILIILLQRGRGGGLTGALGGAGGASAFGVKAGDVFTRITAVSVLLWIVLCALTCYWYLPDKLDIQADPGSMSSGAGSSGAGGMGEADGMGLSEDPSSSVPAISNETPASAPEKTQASATVPPADLQLPPAANEAPATAPKVEEPAAPAADPVAPAAEPAAPAAEPATPAPAGETPAGDGVPK